MRKGENIRKRVDNRWEARYYDKDKNKYVSVYAKSYREVKEKKEKAISKNNIKTKTTVNITIEECFVLFLSGIKFTVKKSTYAKYHDIIYKQIIPIIGKVKLKDITQETINDFIICKLKSGRLDGKGGLAPKTISDILIPFKQCMKKYNLQFNYKLPKKKIANKQIKFLNENDTNKIINYCLLDTTHIKTGILLSLFCGLRLGEICALKWSDIDLANGLLSINKTMQRIKNLDLLTDTKTKIIIDTPKSDKSIRTIPIQIFLINIFKDLKTINDNYILTGSTKYIEPRLYQNKFKDILKELNINDINFHALRHTFATRWLEKGGDIKSLSEILGHSDVSFTINRYVHSTLKQKRIEIEKIAI